MKKYKILIGKLSPTECLTCGSLYPECICESKGKMPQWFNPPILIGDIYKKMGAVVTDNHDELYYLWVKCGIDKSLQTILDENIRDTNICKYCDTNYDTQGGCECEDVQMKVVLTHQAQKLFNFLIEIL